MRKIIRELDPGDFPIMNFEILLNDEGQIQSVKPVYEELYDVMSEFTVEDIENEIREDDRELDRERDLDIAMEDSYISEKHG